MSVEYWFNTRTEKVEEGKLSYAHYRWGPFNTADEAANAREIVQERARKWREDDEDER